MRDGWVRRDTGGRSLPLVCTTQPQVIVLQTVEPPCIKIQHITDLELRNVDTQTGVLAIHLVSKSTKQPLLPT